MEDKDNRSWTKYKVSMVVDGIGECCFGFDSMSDIFSHDNKEGLDDVAKQHVLCFFGGEVGINRKFGNSNTGIWAHGINIIEAETEKSVFNLKDSLLLFSPKDLDEK